jgi:hypothetical protein
MVVLFLNWFVTLGQFPSRSPRPFVPPVNLRSWTPQSNIHQRRQPFLSMTATTSKILTLLIILTASCKSDSEYTIKVEDRHEIVDGKKEIVGQVVQSLRKLDNKPISKLTRVFNYDNDLRIQQLTGLTKDKGLNDYLLDSIYYDSRGNDTLKVSYVHMDKWHRTQITRKEFRADNKIEYFITERNIERHPYSKLEIFYKYSSTGQILSETEFECSQIIDCDSLYKKIFIHDSNGGIDSIMYMWAHNNWHEVNNNSN